MHRNILLLSKDAIHWEFLDGVPTPQPVGINM
jgi:hypothetical protein